MTDTRPPCPVREPTLTLDAFHSALVPGRPRFLPPVGNALGDTDEALQMYQRKFDDIHGVPIADGLLAMVDPNDAAKATQYAADYVRWCTDYNGGFNVGESPNEQPATLAQLATKTDPPIITKGIAAEPVKSAPVVASPAPSPTPTIKPFPPVTAKSAPSLRSRIAWMFARLNAWSKRSLFH